MCSKKAYLNVFRSYLSLAKIGLFVCFVIIKVKFPSKSDNISPISKWEAHKLLIKYINIFRSCQVFIAHLKLGKYTPDISAVIQNRKKMSELLEYRKVDEKLN